MQTQGVYIVAGGGNWVKQVWQSLLKIFLCLLAQSLPYAVPEKPVLHNLSRNIHIQLNICNLRCKKWNLNAEQRRTQGYLEQLVRCTGFQICLILLTIGHLPS